MIVFIGLIGGAFIIALGLNDIAKAIKERK